MSGIFVYAKIQLDMKQWIKMCVVVFFLCATGAGCSFLSRSGPEPFTATSATELVDNGKVIDPESLTSGGTLLVLPFKAGQGIAANEKLDKVALRVIRGLLDAVEAADSTSPFTIVFNEDQGKADYILDGYITGMESPSRFQRWFFGKQRRTLQVEGEITGRDKINPVIVFTDTVKKEDTDFYALGLTAGRHIGNFILDASDARR